MATKSPKLYLRQSCVEDSISTWKPGRFLEIGAGIGLMTAMFLDKGYNGICHDISPESRNYLQINLKRFSNNIQIIDNFSYLSVESFDYLLAFEVLEHIEDDLTALKEWSQFLEKGKKLIVSVPAHQKKFSKSDEYVGHIRRYEKTELFRLLENAGYHNIKIINYGFPLTEVSRIIGNKIMAKDDSYTHLSIEERNLKSSYSSPKTISQYLSFLNDNLFIPFKYIQRWFYSVDWGDGLVAIAEKQ
jgi:SAM-dependent methyltransferase